MRVDDAAGVTVTVIAIPVTTLVNVKDNNGDNLLDARVYLQASDGTGDLCYQESVTSIVRTTNIATVTHATAHGLKTGNYANLAGITGPSADETRDNYGAFQVTVTGTNTYTYPSTGLDTTFTGTITATGAIINDLTVSSGNISSSRSYSLDQPLTGFVRKSSTGSTRFKSFQIAGTQLTGSNLTINVRMILDE